MEKNIIFVDVKKCLACKSCEIACAVEHSNSKDLKKAINEEPKPQPRVYLEGNKDFSMPLQCRHCEDAPCVRICPTGALEKTQDGPVVVQNELCIGCKWCILVCPFGVITMSKKGKMAIKCDLCIERLKNNQETACIQACPTGAIKRVSKEEITKEKRRDTVKELISEIKK